MQMDPPDDNDDVRRYYHMPPRTASYAYHPSYYTPPQNPHYQHRVPVTGMDIPRIFTPHKYFEDQNSWAASGVRTLENVGLMGAGTMAAVGAANDMNRYLFSNRNT